MSTGLYSHTTRATGIILTAAIYNADHQNHIVNLNPTMSGALSDNLAEHQGVSDPGGLGTEILAANLAEELKQLRYVVKRITGKAQWYIAPATDLQSIGGTINSLVVIQDVNFQGSISPAQIVANQNNYAPTGHATTFRFRLNSDASRDITGLAGGANGRLVVLSNIGGFNIVLRNSNGASTAANQFLFPADITLRANSSIVLQYDSTLSRWMMADNTPTDNPVIPGSASIGGDLTLTGNLLAAGYGELPEIAAPANPAADKLRYYAKDVSGTTRLAYRDSAGAESVIGGSAVRAYGEYTANANLSTSVPNDDTIPQITEGTEIIAVSMPALTSASSRVRIEFSGEWAVDSATAAAGDRIFVASLHKDADANALCTTRDHSYATLARGNAISFVFEFAPGAATAATYRIRVGPSAGFTSGNAYRMNGDGAARKYGGAMRAALVCQEVLP